MTVKWVRCGAGPWQGLSVSGVRNRPGLRFRGWGLAIEAQRLRPNADRTEQRDSCADQQVAEAGASRWDVAASPVSSPKLDTPPSRSGGAGARRPVVSERRSVAEYACHRAQALRALVWHARHVCTDTSPLASRPAGSRPAQLREFQHGSPRRSGRGTSHVTVLVPTRSAFTVRRLRVQRSAACLPPGSGRR